VLEAARALIQFQSENADLVFASRSGGQIIGYRFRIDLRADITPHVLRHGDQVNGAADVDGPLPWITFSIITGEAFLA
jgi:hypothetical protein